MLTRGLFAVANLLVGLASVYSSDLVTDQSRTVLAP